MTGTCFLGVDGGGTKTAFTLIDHDRNVVAEYQGGSSYYLQIGMDRLSEVLADGIKAVCPDKTIIEHAFFGLPAYGEDRSIDPILAALPARLLGHHRYSCGNDMICGWAGSLGGEDGINIVAGTGSIGYGERHGVSARAGGWGEVFSDEGSAYWIAVQGLNAFSRMSDGRLVKGPLYEIFRQHFGLSFDLDLCGKIMGKGADRDMIAALSKLVADATRNDDRQATEIFDRAGKELADIANSIRLALPFTGDETVLLSYSGGIFNAGPIIHDPLNRYLNSLYGRFEVIPPKFPPNMGAALYAAKKLPNNSPLPI
jgi:N-acetylglucosamine kinase-like BadF-type ATPase